MGEIDRVIKQWFIFYSILLFFILECFNGIYFFLDSRGSSLSISYPFKIFWEIVVVLLLVSHVKKFDVRYKVFSGFVIVTLLLGGYRFSSEIDLFVWGLKHYNKLFIFLIVYIFLDVYRPNLNIGLKLFDYIIIFNSILIIIGFFTGVEYLKSYPFSERFGYSGVFCRNSVNDVSFFYLIANFYMFYRLKNGNVVLWVFGLVFIASFLVGTKAIYLQNFLLMLYIIIRERDFRIYIMGLGVISIISLLYFYNFAFWKDIINQNGMLSAITSLRSDLLMMEIPLVMDNLSVWSALFGFNNPFQYYVEMDMVDLVFTFGIIGTVLLGYFYRIILFRFKKNNIFAWSFVAVFVLLACISGRYTYSGLNAIYFPMFLYYLKGKDSKSIVNE